MENPGLESRYRQHIFLFCKISTPALRKTPPTIHECQGSFPEVKQLRHEGGHLPTPCADIKSEWSYTSTPPYTFIA